MNKEKPLDEKKLAQYTIELSLEFAKVIISREKTKENHAAAVAALCDVAVIIACKLVGTKVAYNDIIPAAIAHGFRMMERNKEAMDIS